MNHQRLERLWIFQHLKGWGSFDHPEYEMTETDLENSIFSMQNSLRIVYITPRGNHMTFFHRDNFRYDTSGLNEIRFFDFFQITN